VFFPLWLSVFFVRVLPVTEHKLSFISAGFFAGGHGCPCSSALQEVMAVRVLPFVFFRCSSFFFCYGCPCSSVMAVRVLLLSVFFCVFFVFFFFSDPIKQ